MNLERAPAAPGGRRYPGGLEPPRLPPSFELRQRLLPGLVAVSASAVTAVLVADALTESRNRAIVIVYIVVALAATARRGLLGLTQLAVVTLPWLVVGGSRLPRLTETVAAGAVTALVILLASPQSKPSSRSLALRLGIVCFCMPLLLSLAREGYAEQFVQAAKYVVFPALAFAITHATNNRSLLSLRTFALWGGVLAVGTNLLLGLVGYRAWSSYGAGEIVGLARAHDLALLAGGVTAAALASAASSRWVPAVAIGAIATVATGVRSALPGLGAVMIARMFAAGARIRTIVLVVGAIAAVFVSGAADVVEARFQSGENRGEFASLTTLGSGRGKIYSSAVGSWAESSPVEWFVGTGLRSVPRFTEEAIGSPLGGHSDLVDVGVQLGIIGLLGLVLIWSALLVSVRSKAPLIVLGSFAVFNGSLEYSAPVVICLLLTGGARDEPSAHAGGVRPSDGRLQRRRRQRPDPRRVAGVVEPR
jgi:hypothetical protein